MNVKKIFYVLNECNRRIYILREEEEKEEGSWEDRSLLESLWRLCVAYAQRVFASTARRPLAQPRKVFYCQLFLSIYARITAEAEYVNYTKGSKILGLFSRRVSWYTRREVSSRGEDNNTRENHP